MTNVGMCAKLGGLLLIAALTLSEFVWAPVKESLRRHFDRAISKRVARTTGGRYWLLTSRPDTQGRPVFSLRYSRGASPSSLEDFYPPAELSLPVSRPGDPLFSAGMAIDGRNRLHLVWSTEQGLSAYALMDLDRIRARAELKEDQIWLHPELGTAGALVLEPSASRVGDITLAPDGSVWVAWSVDRGEHRTGISVGRMGRRWRWGRVTEGYGVAPPSLQVDRSGRFYLAWHDIYEDTWYLAGGIANLKTSSLGAARKLVARAYRPVMLPTGDRLLAIFESDHSLLEYTFVEEEPAERHPLSQLDSRLHWDTLHSPQIATDRYGVPWLFFINSARRHVFYSRWLGTTWGPIHNGPRLIRNSPRMEDNHLSVDLLSVQEETGADSTGIALTLAHETRFPVTAFHLIQVPGLEAEPGRKVLFLDLKEIQTLDGLELRLNPARKYGGNPILGSGPPGAFDSHSAGTWMRVIKEEGIYRLWYSGLLVDSSQPWWEWFRVGYAESRDGLTFRRVNLALAAFGGRKETNWIPDIPYVPMVCHDPGDADRQRRYQLIRFSNYGMQNDEARAGRLDPWSESINGALFTSGDGIHWREERAEVHFSAGKPFSFFPLTLLNDRKKRDPAKRYKAYGFSALNLARRGGSYAYSSDGLQWTAHIGNPVLDPLARGKPPVLGGKVEQIHDMTVWPYHGYYLAFYQYQYSGERLDVELAVSRDGEKFVFVKPGEKVLALGDPGEWDCEIVSPFLPLVDGEQIKLYYGGTCGQYEYNTSGGLATVRLDGFTHLGLTEKRAQGSLTTIPIRRGSASHLYLNADCGDKAHLEVELLDGRSGQIITGYSRRDSPRLSGDFIIREILWKGQNLRDLESASFKVRIYFSGQGAYPKLYALEFR